MHNYMCSTNSVFVSSRLYEDTHDLIRKPARILYGKIIGQCAVADQQKLNPSNMTHNHFNQVGFMTIIIELF